MSMREKFIATLVGILIVLVIILWAVVSDKERDYDKYIDWCMRHYEMNHMPDVKEYCHYKYFGKV